MGNLKPATFDVMEVGERLGPLEGVADDHTAKAYNLRWMACYFGPETP